MILVRKLSTRISKKGNLESWAIFWCDFCSQEVERRLDSGKKDKSCGCVKNNLISKSHIGKITSEETKQKQSKASMGVKKSEEHRKNISKANKGKIVTEETRQKQSEKAKERFKNPKNHPLFGKPPTEETKQKIQKTLLVNKVAKLENNPNWQGGKSFEIYPQEFKQIREFILERDNYTCQCSDCEHKTDLLDIHHIDYNKKNNNPENLTTLCRSCHVKSNYNRQYYTEFYQNIMMGKRMECLL